MEDIPRAGQIPRGGLSPLPGLLALVSLLVVAYEFALTYSARSCPIGLAALALFLASCYALAKRPPDLAAAASPPATPRWRGHLALAAAVFLLGLYLNTGSLAPYAITSAPIIDAHGNAFNADHAHFHALYDFVSGHDRELWEHAILIRRILFPVLAWPFTTALGFELGGVVANLVFNTAAVIAFVVLVQRALGPRAAVAAAWLLAFYPGAAYWAGQPYLYGTIVPLSLLLTAGLLWLDRVRGKALLLLSVGMGVAYLSYDLAAYYLPASLLILLWRRRYAEAAWSGILQVLPLAAWSFLFTHVLGFAQKTSNSTMYAESIGAYLHPSGLGPWLHELAATPRIAVQVFLGANFLFLPLLFLAGIAVNARTCRLGLSAAEGSLLLAGFCLFAFINFAPPHPSSWEMRGPWIARLYQPLFPAFILFLARVWDQLPRLNRAVGLTVAGAIAVAFAANTLVILGPILGNPLHVSQLAFARFYDHNTDRTVYPANLAAFGRRPLGLTKPHLTNAGDELALGHVSSGFARDTAALAQSEKLRVDLENILVANQKALRDIARAIGENRALLAARRGDHHKSAVEWRPSYDPPLPPDAVLDATPPALMRPSPATEREVLARIEEDNQAVPPLMSRINAVQHQIATAQQELRRAIAALAADGKNSKP
jgi:hypothetical protein